MYFEIASEGVYALYLDRFAGPAHAAYMVSLKRRVPDVHRSEVGLFHLVHYTFTGEYRAQRSIEAIRSRLYHDLLDRHRIIAFDSVSVYLDLNDTWSGRGLAGFWFRENPDGVAGARAHLDRHFGADSVQMEDGFDRAWSTMTEDTALHTTVVPEQSAFEVRIPYRSEATTRRWTPHLLPYLVQYARAQRQEGGCVLEVADTIRKELRYLFLQKISV